ncbi:MAG: SDR family oxidoreductase [Actinomycetota bacterium]|nr:MAG: SDR family oxidoreductase [Actinomycetota bacterium]
MASEQAVASPSHVAVVTGGSRGLGRELARSLGGRGWTVIIDGRDPRALAAAVEAATDIAEVPSAGTGSGRLVAIAGDVGDPAHRESIATAVAAYGRLDLVVNNASTLGTSPLPPLRDYDIETFAAVLHTNTVAPLALLQLLLPHLRATAGTVINLSSDAATEAYVGWGAYGASKAALDQLSAVLAAEEPDLRSYAFDPGDMRTAMHQLAFPGQDISDRPEPVTVLPALLRLIDQRPPSGRFRAADLAPSRPSPERP